MNESSTLLKVGATDLVLRMIESGANVRDLGLENPIRAIREISHDITGRRKVRLANDEASALEIQDEHCRLATSSTAATWHAGRSACSRRVERTLKAVDSGDLALVEREIDWVTKHRLIERYRDRTACP